MKSDQIMTSSRARTNFYKIILVVWQGLCLATVLGVLPAQQRRVGSEFPWVNLHLNIFVFNRKATNLREITIDLLLPPRQRVSCCQRLQLHSVCNYDQKIWTSDKLIKHRLLLCEYWFVYISIRPIETDEKSIKPVVPDALSLQCTSQIDVKFPRHRATCTNSSCRTWSAIMTLMCHVITTPGYSTMKVDMDYDVMYQ